jgi:death-on-curing protein
LPSEPRWLTADHAIRFNERAVEATGEPFQVRDRGLLESAMDSPKNHWHHGEHRVPYLGAHLLLSVARNHPFAQGNKRVALLVADAFLTVNQHRLQHPDEGFADLILSMLTREIAESEFLDKFARAVASPVPPAVRRASEIEREMRSGLFSRAPTNKK